MSGPAQSSPGNHAVENVPNASSRPTRPPSSTTVFQWGIPPPASSLPPRRPIPTSTAPLPVSPPNLIQNPWSGLLDRAGEVSRPRSRIISPSNRSNVRVTGLPPDYPWTGEDGGSVSIPTFRQVMDNAERRAGNQPSSSSTPAINFARREMGILRESEQALSALRRTVLEEPWIGRAPSAVRLPSGTSTPPTNLESSERHRPRIVSSSNPRQASSLPSDSKTKIRLDFLANTLAHHKISPWKFEHPHLPSYLQGHPRALTLSLPTVFSEADKHSNLSLDPGGLCVAFTSTGLGDDNDASAIRTRDPIPPTVGIYYYEVEVKDRGELGFLSVGFSKRSVHLNRLVGWEPGSWGWHGDDGRSFEEMGEGRRFGPMYTTGDIVGAGINFVTGKAFFTKNGELIGHCFSGLEKAATHGLFPSVGLRSPREVLRANFAGPFSFDIDTYYNSFRDDFFQEAITHSIPDHLQDMIATRKGKEKAHDPLPGILPAVISNYLKHHGFSDVSHKFDKERQRRQALQTSPGANSTAIARDDSIDTSESLNYVLRLVHDLIVIDEIQEAIRIIRLRYPKVLDKGTEGGKWGFWMDALAFIKVLREVEISAHPQDEDMEVDGLLTSPGSGSTASTTSTGKRKRANSSVTSSPEREPVKRGPLDEAIRLGGEIRDRWAPNDKLPFGELFTLFGKPKIDEVVEGQAELSIASKERRALVADGVVRAIRVLHNVPTSSTLEQTLERTKAMILTQHTMGDPRVAFADVSWVLDGKAP